MSPWLLENIIELPAIADETTFFEDGCPMSSLSLQLHERTEADLSIEVGGPELALAVARRVCINEERVRNVAEGIAGFLSGPLGESVRGNLHETPLGRALGETLRDLAAHWAVHAGDQARSSRPGVVEWSYGERTNGRLLRGPSVEVLGGHD